MIQIHDLTKRYGDTTAVDRLAVDVQPGWVTGFLGPSGAREFTIMWMVLGLDHKTEGTPAVNERQYRGAHVLTEEVCAFRDAKATHGRRIAYSRRLGVGEGMVG